MVLTPSVTSEENVHHVVLYRQQFTRSTPVLVKMFDWIKTFLWALEINPTNEPGVEGLKPYSTPSQFGFPYF